MTAQTSQSLALWLREEPFTLALSAGFFGFFAHAGLVAALEEEGIAPARITGASAGALVGAAWASGVSARDLLAILSDIRRPDFWDVSPGFGLLRGQRFQEILERTLDCETFEQCRVPASFSVWHIRSRQTEVVDSGQLAAAVRASCCFPGLLQPVDLGGRLFLDGGISDRPAIAAISPNERVLAHHLASKSPWRLALSAPSGPNMKTLAIPGLPRLSPFDLEAGPEAFEAARVATLNALRRPTD
ncbi:MAG: NTE family protein [Bradymonadia bacterium]|jgi:NTE family protein